MSTDEKLPYALDNYRLLGNSGLRVSPLCLGTMTFGTEWGWGADREESHRQFELYTAKGGNFIDTANVYTKGQSEEYVGEFIAHERERYVVATKFSFGMNPGDPNSGGNARKNIMQAVDASLRRMNTEYIDLYWLHVWEYRAPVEEVMRALDDLVRLGKVFYIGFSDTPAWKCAQAQTLAQLRGWSPLVALQIEYSLIERTVEPELLGMARELGLGVTPWSPLGAGVLTGKYLDNPEGDGEGSRAKGTERRRTERNNAIAQLVVDIAQECGKTPAQVALNWLLRQRGVTSPILGARTVQQLEDNLGAADFVLDSALLERLNEASAAERDPFPHNFTLNPGVNKNIAAQTQIEQRLP
jgi:aryl-alcohol dehydrogenase-like predicted oxidoreductase